VINGRASPTMAAGAGPALLAGRGWITPLSGLTRGRNCVPRRHGLAALGDELRRPPRCDAVHPEAVGVAPRTPGRTAAEWTKWLL